MFFTYINSVLGATLGVRCYYCHHFMDEETETQRGLYRAEGRWASTFTLKSHASSKFPFVLSLRLVKRVENSFVPPWFLWPF